MPPKARTRAGARRVDETEQEMDEIRNMLQQQAAMINQLMQRQQQMLQQQQQQPPVAPLESQEEMVPEAEPSEQRSETRITMSAPLALEPLYERFRKQQPPVFEGDLEPTAAEEWIEAVEEIFEFMDLSDVERISCATHLFKKNARHWWNMIRSNKDMTSMTWGEFKSIFYDKYFSPAERADRISQFLQLRQGSMSVMEYVKKFEDLARFAPEMTSSESTRIQKFKQGLKAELLRDMNLSTTEVTPYNQVIDKAMQAEKDEARIIKSHERTERGAQERRSFQTPWNRKRKDFPMSKGKPQWKKEGYFSKRKEFIEEARNTGERKGGSNERKENKTAPLCSYCNITHFGECRRKNRTCFFCGKGGHFIAECPNLKERDKTTVEAKKTNARVFAITRADAKAGNSNTVTDKGKAVMQ